MLPAARRAARSTQKREASHGSPEDVERAPAPEDEEAVLLGAGAQISLRRHVRWGCDCALPERPNRWCQGRDDRSEVYGKRHGQYKHRPGRNSKGPDGRHAEDGRPQRYRCGDGTGGHPHGRRGHSEHVRQNEVEAGPEVEREGEAWIEPADHAAPRPRQERLAQGVEGELALRATALARRSVVV